MVAHKASYWVVISVLIITASASFQHPFGTQKPEFTRKRLANLKKDTVRSTPPVPLNTHHAYDDGLFTPMEDLSSLSQTDFTVISHPFFPNVGARIKKTRFCDQTVKCAFHCILSSLSVDPSTSSAHTLGTLTFKPDIFSSTFLRADATQTGTTSYFGPTEAQGALLQRVSSWNSVSAFS